MTTPKIICPVCWHEETHRALRQGDEATHDDPQMMFWNKPYGGARGQQCTPWDNGWWSCEYCQLRVTEPSAFLLIDSVLRNSDPDSDSYDKETKCFKDALLAFKKNWNK